jgi:hypothetical protein
MGTPSKSHKSDLLGLSQAIALLSACNTCQISDTKKPRDYLGLIEKKIAK